MRKSCYNLEMLKTQTYISNISFFLCIPEKIPFRMIKNLTVLHFQSNFSSSLCFLQVLNNKSKIKISKSKSVLKFYTYTSAQKCFHIFPNGVACNNKFNLYITHFLPFDFLCTKSVWCLIVHM